MKAGVRGQSVSDSLALFRCRESPRFHRQLIYLQILKGLDVSLERLSFEEARSFVWPVEQMALRQIVAKKM